MTTSDPGTWQESEPASPPVSTEPASKPATWQEDETATEAGTEEEG